MNDLTNKIKDFWNNRPCNIRHSQKEIGSKEYFEEVDAKRYYVEPHILRFADFNNWKNKKVLELGCGIGTDSIRFAKAGALITVCDISEKSMEITKQRFKEYNLNANFYICNLEELTNYIPIEKYDLIYSFGVIHHASDPQKIIDQIKYYCDTNTLIKIMLYSKICWKSISFYIIHGYKFYFNFNKTIQYFAEAQIDCPVAFTYTKSQIKQLFNKYKIISIAKDHIFTYKISDYIRGKYNKTLLFKFMPNIIFNILKKYLGWHYLIELKIKEDVY